jgi:riboflavin kinase/FMN adenylyltransferase
MAVFFEINHLPAFNNAVLTIGTFDGVHMGHKVILKSVAEQARDMNGESVLITFEPHPRKLLFPEQPLKLLTPLEQKLKLIEAAGIQNIVVVPFTQDFAGLSAQEYVENFLVEYFHPRSIIIGYDHHFGHDRKGNIELLKEFATKYQYRLVEIPAQLIESAAVSSTKIRRALEQGHVHEAAQMLGRNYSITGAVVKGSQLGRTIGYPTANIMPAEPEQLIPANGIYAVRVKWDGHLFGGMMSIGFNPTVTEKKDLRIEVNLFDFDRDIYNHMLKIEFVAWLREEEKFNSIDELKEQLAKDKIATLKVLE